MRYSIRLRYALIVAGLIIVMIAGSIFLNLSCFEAYYFWNKEKTISEMYELIEESLGNGMTLDSASELSLRLYCENSNLDMMILEGGIVPQTIFCRGNERELRVLTLAYLYGNRYDPENVIAKDENHYVCQAYDDQLRSEFLESFGTTENRSYFIMMRTPLQNMKENILLANQFYLLTAVVTLVLGTVIAYFLAGQMSRPITELSGIARKMAGLDFSARYRGNEIDEIGELGNNMNHLADQLECTIAELKAANLELQRDIERKEERENMRQEFLAGVSHELKTPIALIQGYAEGLRDGISEDPESRAWYCDVIVDEAAKMNAMVRQMLTLNEIEFGSNQGKMERFDISQMIQGVLASYQIMFQQKDVKLDFQVDSELYVWADELRIEDVLRNYVSNALNHVDEERRITVTSERKDGLVRISVTNTGQPIPAGEMEKIWLRFYKVDKARTREYGGNGIGLSIVKAVMEAHGRNFGAYNREDGVTFWFELDAESGVTAVKETVQN
ncbi:MAG: HAMP domain-containing protein [Lachnospiraceae bacterium]|nr:HAMP domain-containing protein [Lachnospiraceae bacterium]